MYVRPSSFWTIPATFGGLEKVKSATYKVNSVAYLGKSVTGKVKFKAHLGKGETDKVKSKVDLGKGASDKVKSVAHLVKSMMDKVNSVALLTKSVPHKGEYDIHLVTFAMETVKSIPVKPADRSQKPAFGTTAAETIMAMTEIVTKLTRRIL